MEKKQMPVRPHKRYAYLLLLFTVCVAMIGLFLPSFWISHVKEVYLHRTGRAEIGFAYAKDMEEVFAVEPLTTHGLVKFYSVKQKWVTRFQKTTAADAMSAERAVVMFRREVEQLEKQGVVPRGTSDFSGAQYSALLCSYGTEGPKDRERAEEWEISIYRDNMDLMAAVHSSSGKILWMAGDYKDGTTENPITPVLDSTERAVQFAHYLGIPMDRPEVTSNEEDFVVYRINNLVEVQSVSYGDETSLFFSLSVETR